MKKYEEILEELDKELESFNKKVKDSMKKFKNDPNEIFLDMPSRPMKHPKNVTSDKIK